jgi:hypothetical protein
MGLSGSKSSKQKIKNLEKRIDVLEEYIDQQKTHPAISAVAVEVVSDEKKAISKPPWQPAHRIPPSGDQYNINSEWEIVDGGGVQIGPGSYYTGDNTITLIDENVTNETQAHEWIKQYESGPEYNPIVMWQIGKFHGNSVCIWAHRLRYMHQNLDADTGTSPKRFVSSTKAFLSTKKGEPKGRVFVRTDEWWRLQSESSGNGSKSSK